MNILLFSDDFLFPPPPSNGLRLHVFSGLKSLHIMHVGFCRTHTRINYPTHSSTSLQNYNSTILSGRA
mgnify:CR=1 FL=1